MSKVESKPVRRLLVALVGVVVACWPKPGYGDEAWLYWEEAPRMLSGTGTCHS